MKRTRVAIVGAGFGRYGLAPAFRGDPRCEVVAVCTSKPETAARFAGEIGIARAYSDVEQMLDDGGIDAVAVATPPYAQATVIRSALARSIPVFAEKLLALSVAEARELADRADERRTANMIDYIFPELETWSAARAMLQRGFVGTPRHIAVNWMMESYDHAHGLSTWKTDARLGGGALHHFGPHVFNYVEGFMGSITRLSASLRSAPDLQRPEDTTAVVSLDFASGASGSIVLSSAAPLGSGHRVEITGSDGTITLANDTRDTVRGFRLGMRNKTDEAVPDDLAVATKVPTASSGLDSRVGPVSKLTSRFVTWIQDGVAARPSFAEGVRVQTLLNAAVNSSETGSPSVIAG